MMVPGYGEELEMGLNATSPSAIANSARTNLTESLQQGTLMWSTSLRPIYANGPQLICTHYVEKKICWKGECYVGTLRKSSGLFLSWEAAMPSSGALVSDNDTWPCPHAPKHLIKYFFLYFCVLFHILFITDNNTCPSPITSYHVLCHFFDFHVLFIILFTTDRNTWPSPHNPKQLLKYSAKVLGFYVSLHLLQTMTYRRMPADSITYCQIKNCITHQHFVVGF